MKRHSATGRLWASMVVAGATMFMLPSAASASAVAVGGGYLNVTDPANIAQATTVAFDAASGDYIVDDGGAPTMTAVAPCLANPAGTMVQCPGAGVSRIYFDGAGGIDDLFIDATVPTVIATMLKGGTGPDVLNGGGGNDFLDGGDGADIFNGGAGKDTATYRYRIGVAGVRVRLGAGPVSGNGADGPPGARDLIAADVENAIGTLGVDYLIGNGLANSLNGGARSDKIAGKGGDDELIGRGGRDILRGGPGADLLFGGVNRDNYAGQGGDDILYAHDGLADLFIDCGNGAGDVADVDAFDPAPVSC